MFGYIAPQKEELKVRELCAYNAYYCGLCKTIGKHYGEQARLGLNYDCSFLALLIDSLCAPADCKKQRCIYKPASKPRAVMQENEPLRFAAAMNVLLAYYKAKDDWQDERSIKGLAGKIALKVSAGKAAGHMPVLDKTVHEGICALSLLERQRCDEVDMVSGVFSKMMGKCMESVQAPGNNSSIVLVHLAENIGKWIYLADAWDDREKDVNSGNYNIFNIIDADAERAEFLLNCSLNEAIKAYELLDITANKGLLDNIFYVGCVNKTQRIIGGIDGKSL